MPDTRPKAGSVQRRLVLVAAAALLLLLSACGGQNPPTNQKGRVSGTIVVGATGSGAGQAGTTDSDPDALSEASLVVRRAGQRAGASGADVRDAGARTTDDGAVAANTTLGTARALASHDESVEFVPGELIVRYADGGVAPAALPDLEAVGATFTLERSLAVDGMRLYVAPGLDKAETLAAARALNARPDVLYAHPNYLVQPALVPNDPGYVDQWHYHAIDMEGAWDITTGNDTVVVAVLDTGIIDTHPDFAGRLLPGYDFITQPGISNDGDGRDSDPWDEVPATDYHGTHVAGTIGAASNNGVGMTGVDWHAKILPLRVLGVGGGALSDIIDAMLWSVGASVPNVPFTNSNPADVVNLSLGIGTACTGAWQDAVNYVNQYAVVVAAAGNTNSSANNFSPASCNGLITVGATDYLTKRAHYSNYGSAIDVMAPGGDVGAIHFDPPNPDGVLSLRYINGSHAYGWMQGTSMAAPHVSGIVALMKAIDPTVDFERALAALRASATPLSDSACDSTGASRTLVSEDCGNGLIDAALALQYVTDEVPPDGALAFKPTTLNLGQTADQATYSITNATGSTLEWSMTEYLDAVDNPGHVVEGAIGTSATSGQLAPGATEQLTLYLDRSLLTADGFYRIWLIFEVDGEPEQYYQVRFQRGGASVPTLSGPMVVAAFQDDGSGNLLTSGEQQSAGALNSFNFEVQPGLNLLGAWSDENDDGLVNAGDFIGFANDFVNVPAGGHISGIVLRVDPVIPELDPGETERQPILEGLMEGR